MEQFKNNPSTTLTNAGGISDSALSLTVASGSQFPSSGTFRVLIEGELVKVTAVSGTTWTITRGDGGSVPNAHALGVPIYGILTAEALNDLVSIQSAGTEVSARRVINFVSGATVSDNSGSARCDVTIPPSNSIGYGAGASRPAAGMTGNVYVSSDGVIVSVDTGSAWVGFNSQGACYNIPPLVSAWTTFSDGTYGTVSNIPGGGIFFKATNVPTNNGYIGLRRALSNGASYSVIANFVVNGWNDNNPKAGILITDASKFIMFGTSPTDGNPYQVETFSTMNPITATKSIIYGKAMSYGDGFSRWYRVDNDGTHRTYYISTDGINWIQFYQEAYTVFVTETSAGLFVTGAGTGSNPGIFSMTAFSWSGA